MVNFSSVETQARNLDSVSAASTYFNNSMQQRLTGASEVARTNKYAQ
jgi:hypothetical protein